MQMANEELPSVWHLRETQALLGWSRKCDSGLVRNADLRGWLSRQPRGPWIELLQEAVEEHGVEIGAGKRPVDSFVEWLAEWGREVRRRQRGLLLLTAHRAKGLEFDHVVVLDGRWDRVGPEEDPDAPRRLYYVAMTRARRTLALGRFAGSHTIQDALRNSSAVFSGEPVTLPSPVPEMARRYRGLALRDVYLSFAGRKPPSDRVHRAIAALSPGDRLRVQRQSDRWELLDGAGVRCGNACPQLRGPTRHALYRRHCSGGRLLDPRLLGTAISEATPVRQMGGRSARTCIRTVVSCRVLRSTDGGREARCLAALRVWPVVERASCSSVLVTELASMPTKTAGPLAGTSRATVRPCLVISISAPVPASSSGIAYSWNGGWFYLEHPLLYGGFSMIS